MAASSGTNSSPPSSFDIESYIANYSGFTRLKRLQFIATTEASLKLDALRIALEEVRRTTNTQLYNELIALAADTNAFKRDDAWVET